MSDYLWDKTGEPDAETERLEELLGQLRFQPTPFDLPAGLPATEFRAARPRRSVLSWPRLALAASVTLAVLAGAWLVLRQQAAVTNGGQQVARQGAQPNAGEEPSAAAASKATEGTNGDSAGGENRANQTPAPAPPRDDEAGREELAGVRLRPRVPNLDKNRSRRLPRAAATRVNRGESAGVPKSRTNLGTPGAEPAPREERAQLAAEREAAEKVLYALRVTSEKLNYARRQVREAARGEDNR